MAFQRTKGRSVFTQPTGMPDLSGFKSAANAYQQLGQSITQFGTEIRNRDYKNAIRQAEIDGKTAGVKYTKDENGQWKLSPLVNLDYSEAVKGLPASDGNKVLQAHREAAVASYVAAAVNDINSSANIAYTKHKNDPDQVRAEMNGYAEGLREQLNDDSIFAQLAPKIESAFLSAENQAFAQQQKETEEAGIASLKKSFNNTSLELANIMSVGYAETDDTSVEGFEMRVQELQDEQMKMVEDLTTLGLNETEVQELFALRENTIAVRVGENLIEGSFQEGGLAGSMNLALQIYDESLSNPDIDSDSLSAALFAKANQLEKIRVAEKEAISRQQEEIRSNIRYQYTVGGANINDMLMNPDHPIHSLKGSTIASLFTEGDAAINAEINETYSQNHGFVENWKTYNTDEQRSSITDGYINVRKQWIKGEIDSDQWAKTKSSFDEYTDHVLNSEDRIRIGLAVSMALGPNSPYDKAPKVYADLLPDLIQKGVVGKNGTYKTSKAFIDAVDTYSKNWKKHDEEERAAQKGIRMLQAGVPINQEIQEAVSKVYGTNKAIVGDKIVDMDFFSDDLEVIQASVDTADAYSNRFNGLIHPEARTLFKNYMRSEASANMAIQVLSQVATGLVKNPEYTFQNQGQALDHIWRVNDFTPQQRKFFQIASNAGVELAMEATKWEKRSESERNITDEMMPGISGDLSKAEKADAFFDEAVRESLGAFGFYNFVDFDQQGPVVQQMLENLASSTGLEADELANVVITEPGLREQMKNMFFERYIYEHKLNMPKKDTMRSVFADFGTRYGFEKDSETGDIFYVKNPIIRNAQSTIPPVEKGKFRGKPIFRVNMKMIEQDFITRMTGAANADPKLLPSQYQQDFRDVLAPDDNMHAAKLTFVANEVAAEGNIPSYSVYLKDRFGVTKLYSKSYRFDYKTSTLSEDYERAHEAIRSQPVKRFMRIANAFDPMLVQQQMNKYAASRDSNDLTPLFDLVNGITSVTSGTAFDISDFRLDDEDGADLMNFFQYYTSLGTY